MIVTDSDDSVENAHVSLSDQGYNFIASSKASAIVHQCEFREEGLPFRRHVAWQGRGQSLPSGNRRDQRQIVSNMG